MRCAGIGDLGRRISQRQFAEDQRHQRPLRQPAHDLPRRIAQHAHLVPLGLVHGPAQVARLVDRVRIGKQQPPAARLPRRRPHGVGLARPARLRAWPPPSPSPRQSRAQSPPCDRSSGRPPRSVPNPCPARRSLRTGSPATRGTPPGSPLRCAPEQSPSAPSALPAPAGQRPFRCPAAIAPERPLDSAGSSDSPSTGFHPPVFQPGLAIFVSCHRPHDVLPFRSVL